MIILLGKTASGKDTILNELISEYGYKKIITYTTRPIREGEKQDVTYHFISEEEFVQKINEGFFLEYKSYGAIDGVWYYGSVKNDIENAADNSVIILTPAEYRDFVKSDPPIPYSAFYIYANNQVIKERLMKRGDKPEEAKRRLSQDIADFKNIEHEVEKIIYNNGDKNIVEVVNKLKSYLR